jgi:hypothetical protein
MIPRLDGARMATAFTFEYEVSPEIIADAAATTLIAQRAGQPSPQMRKAAIAWGILFFQVLGVLIVAIVVELPDWVIALAAALTVVFALCFGLYLFVVVLHPLNQAIYERNISRAFRKLDTPRIRWDLSEAGFTVETRTTRREQPWTTVREAFVGRKFWILTLVASERLLIPVLAMPVGAERFLLDCIIQAGGALRMEEHLEAG